jgi:preprotein translocase subunit SecG
MDILLHIIHALSALILVVLILLQQGKGAEAGASFGAGASGTMFGSAGSGNFMTRSTAVLAAIFMATSLALAWVARNQAKSEGVGVPALNKVIQEQQSQSSKSAAQIPATVSVPAAGQQSVPVTTSKNTGTSTSEVPSLSTGPSSNSVPAEGDAPAGHQEK